MSGSRKIFFISLAGILLSLFVYLAFRQLNMGMSISRNILLLTNPVMSFSGKVQKVGEEALWLTRTVYTQERSSAPVKKNTLTYKIAIDERTKMQYLIPGAPYLFKARSESRPVYMKPDMRKFKTGQVINVTSREDLRRYSKDTFTAEFLYLQPVANSVFGIISEVLPHGLRLNAILPPKMPFSAADNLAEELPGLPGEKVYIVEVNPDTEISYLDYTNPGEPRPVKLDFSQLKPGLPVEVYSDADVYDTDTITALLIQPKITPAPQRNDKGLSPVP